jgi:hypothetical protein
MSVETFHNKQTDVSYENISTNSQPSRCNIVNLIEKVNLEKKTERKKNILFFFSFVSVVALVVSVFSLVH